MIHTDFNNDNILFRGNKLIGIIDFDSVEFAPLAKDVALAGKRMKYPQWRIDDKKIPFYIKKYRKNAPFSKREEKLIVPLLIGEDCGLIKRFYWDMKKHLNERYEAIAETLNQTKLLASWLGWRTKI